MNIRHLEQFLTICRYQHMAEAADALNTSQPALSRNLSALEEELGVPLFDRVGRRIVLNQNGETFAEYAEQVLALLKRAQLSMKNTRYLTGGHIRISSIVYAGVVTDWISRYRKLNPLVSFSIEHNAMMAGEYSLENPDFILKAVDGEYELSTQNPNWVVKPLLREQNYIISSPDYCPIDWDKAESPLPLARLKDAEFIVVDNVKSIYFDRTYEFCKQAGFFPNISCRVSDFITKMKCVRDGTGVSLVPGSCLEDAKFMVPGLRAFPMQDMPERTLVLLRPRKSMMSETVADFYQFILDFYNLSDQDAE